MLPAVRFIRWTVLGSILVAVIVSVVLAGRSPSSPQSLSALFGGGTVDTPWGPLSASDRDLLIKVRQANLWEGPSGEEAAQRAENPAVREVGRKLGIEHAQLDVALRAAAEKLGVALPSQPSDQQKVWMSEISRAAGPQFDRVFINLVRAAHGEVMPLVEGVRSGTQNEVVRGLAIEGSAFIGRHMGYLESTRMVDYSLLPPSTAPVARLTSIGNYNVPVTLLLFLIAVGIGAAALRGLGRSKQTGAGATPWWARAAAPLLAMAGSVGRRALRSARERREFKDRMVTTAELIAVLESEEPRQQAISSRRARAHSAVDTPTWRSTIPAQRSQSPAGPDTGERRPPKLGRGSTRRGW